MSFRKRGINRENTKDSAESQEVDVPFDKDEVSTTSAAARELRRREREHKSQNKEMTEEEMMALALRLSEQEANITAQKLQEEEEAVKKALKDSMVAESQSLIDADPPCLPPRRKLIYSNGESQSVIECSTTYSGDDRGHMNRTRKRRRLEDSPLMEMPDLSQTQPSPSSSESAALNSPKSCDSTQIEDCDLLQSPVFPLSSAQVKVRIPRMDQDLLDSCTASGFVLCTQEGSGSTQISHCQQPTCSPTFPKSPALHSENPKAEETNSQILQNVGDDTELSQEPHISPVFGQTDCKSALQTETVKAAALTFSSPGSSVSFCLEKDVILSKSPVFSKTEGESDRDEGNERHSPVFGTNGRTVTTCEEELDEQEDKEVEEEQNMSQMEPSVDMTLHWSEEDEDSTTPVVSPSPVFPEERRVLQSVNKIKECASSQTQCRATVPQSQSAVGEDPSVFGTSALQSTVHYYWGVPFCPRGLDPGQYTKVIVAQMEVYEKCLKQAQRGLLNKATWGEPILPQTEKCPSPESNSAHLTRRSRRLRGKLKELESEEEVEDMTEDSQGCQRSQWEEEDGHEEGDKEITHNTEKDSREEEEKGHQKEPMKEAVLEGIKEDETQVESDCEVCPETQLSDDITQELTLPSQSLVKNTEIEMVQVDSPNVPEPQAPSTPEPQEPMEQGPKSPEELDIKSGDMDLGGPPCETKSRESPLQSQSPDLDQNLDKILDSEEVPGPDQVTGPDLVPVQVSGPEIPVQCPICLRGFPSDKIEMHAAFCDGEPAEIEKASPKPWRKRTRKGETEDANHTNSERSVSQAQEKCYICQKAVPLRDYSLHTDRCLQRPMLRATNTGGLLSALDQSEPRDSVAGPSGSTAQPQEVIDLVDDDEDEDSVSLIRISNSPIRSFTSISDAQDCLIDFNRQHLGKRPGTRPGPKAGTKQRSKRR